MRANGAMVMLLRNFDYTKIKFLGRWHLDGMMKYLHTPVDILMQNYIAAMVANGEYAHIHAVVAEEMA